MDGDVVGAVDGASDVAGAEESGAGSAAAGPANTLVNSAAAVSAANPRATERAFLDVFTNSHP
ncbi:hypothetical protein [Amycolatopsis sp. lyj-23]|uniref:hypothetical protein n=1 Tax=Amycolatopsis sp. lyj-23 TaxID=2789283 RepID=UPI00397B02CB